MVAGRRAAAPTPGPSPADGPAHDLNGQVVYTRADLHARHGLGLSTLERLYRERGDNGHPEAIGKIGLALAWEAREWDRWYHAHLHSKTAQPGTGGGLVTLQTIASQYGVTHATAARNWAQHQRNGHPQPVDGSARPLEWDPTPVARWYAAQEAKKPTPPRAEDPDRLLTLPQALAEADRLLGRKHSTADVADLPAPVENRGKRSNDTAGSRLYRLRDLWDHLADREITLADAARVGGMKPTSITRYPERPPVGWPAPIREESTPGGNQKRAYRAGDVWDYFEVGRRVGGGKPPGARKRRWLYDGDERLDIARRALRETPTTAHVGLARRLSDQHGGTPGTWSHILGTARKHPEG